MKAHVLLAANMALGPEEISAMTGGELKPEDVVEIIEEWHRGTERVQSFCEGSDEAGSDLEPSRGAVDEALGARPPTDEGDRAPEDRGDATDDRRDASVGTPTAGTSARESEHDTPAVETTAGGATGGASVKGLAGGSNASGTTTAETRNLTPGEGWRTVSEAAIVSGADKGVISRAAGEGRLKSNGMKGRARRIDAADLTRWTLERAKRPERGESDEHVNRLMGRGGSK
jgi:hypothetical protein